MTVEELIAVSQERRAAAHMRQEKIVTLQTRLRIYFWNSEVTDKEFIDAMNWFLGDEEIVTAFNKLSDGGVKIVISKCGIGGEQICLRRDGSLFVDHRTGYEIIRCFFELTQTRKSA